MLIEFDPAKDAINRQRHGVGLGEYARLDLEAALAFDSPRDGEARTVQLGPITGRLYVAIVTYRGAATRVINLRRANPREERRYAKAKG